MPGYSSRMVNPPVQPVTQTYNDLEAAQSLVGLGGAQPKKDSLHNLHTSEDKFEQ